MPASRHELLAARCAVAAIRQPGGSPAESREPCMGLFPDAKPELIDPDPDLQQAFDAAIATFGHGLEKTPIVLVSLEDVEPHDFAGQLVEEVHYSASLLKATAMWAAFELRRAANELIPTAHPAPADTLALLRDTFDREINDNRVAQLAGKNLEGFLLPRWDKVFQVQPDATVNFTPDFFGKLFDAIVDGSNSAAGTVVHGLGFGYLTKAAATAEFFDDGAVDTPQTADGMWLCGDFGHGFPPQRIPCVNDTPVAQATSAFQMARLFTFLAAGPGAAGAPGVDPGRAPDPGNTPLVDAASDEAMLKLLFNAVDVPRLHLFLNRDTSVQFVTFQSKIGLGPVNSGTKVASEAAIIKEASAGRRFVAVFQNRAFVNDSSIVPVSQVIDATIANFLFP
jgi:hypothetical protein